MCSIHCVSNNQATSDTTPRVIGRCTTQTSAAFQVRHAPTWHSPIWYSAVNLSGPPRTVAADTQGCANFLYPRYPPADHCTQCSQCPIAAIERAERQRTNLEQLECADGRQDMGASLAESRSRLHSSRLHRTDLKLARRVPILAPVLVVCAVEAADCRRRWQDAPRTSEWTAAVIGKPKFHVDYMHHSPDTGPS